MPILTELTLYPIKSCAGISLREATLTSAGLMSDYIYDREWMLVDSNGEFLTQREAPKMATIVPSIKGDALELRAPGMLRLRVPLDLPSAEQARTIHVEVWGENVQALDCDDTTAAWFSNAVGLPCRLVRFHPDAKRTADPHWTQGLEAPTLFSDGFPLLVVSQASLADLNDKLTAQGRAALPMNRFRPNLVLSDTGAYDEDHASTIKIGAAVLRPVKPCARCSIPSIDQESGIAGPDPMDILQTYRSDPRLGGSITFGMNAVLQEGEGTLLRVGQEVGLELAF